MTQQQDQTSSETDAAGTGVFAFVTLTTNHQGGGEPSGVVDLAIFRERSTTLPAWTGSGLKGGLRAATQPEKNANGGAEDAWLDLFGLPGAETGRMGLVHVEDGHLVALPVPTPGTAMAWVTSPFLLRRLRQECDEAGIALADEGKGGIAIPDVDFPTCLAADHLWLAMDGNSQALWLCDLVFERPTPNPADLDNAEALRCRWARVLAQRWYPDSDDAWRSVFERNLVIIPDAAMRHLASMLDVRPRIKIQSDGKDPGLWFEEVLPDHTLLYARWSVQPVPAAAYFKADKTAEAARWMEGEDKSPVPGLPSRPKRLFVGGKLTTGHGRVAVSSLSRKAQP